MKKGHTDWTWIALNRPREWRRFFSFAVVRNPWDVAVSGYFWFKSHAEQSGVSNEEFGTFDQWVRTSAMPSLNPWPMIAHQGEPVVDRVLRYETLHQELATVPVPYAGEMLTTFKKSGCRDGQNYRRFFNDDSRELVAQHFRDMIDYFGYEF